MVSCLHDFALPTICELESFSFVRFPTLAHRVACRSQYSGRPAIRNRLIQTACIHQSSVRLKEISQEVRRIVSMKFFGPGLRTPPIFSENDRSKYRGSDLCRRWSAEGWKRSAMKLCGFKESLINLDLGSWCSWHHIHILVLIIPIQKKAERSSLCAYSIRVGDGDARAFLTE